MAENLPDARCLLKGWLTDWAIVASPTAVEVGLSNMKVASVDCREVLAGHVYST